MTGDDLGLSGLSGLTDDQLIELVRAGLRELASRDQFTQDAAQQMVISERERWTAMRDGGLAYAAAARDQLRQEAAEHGRRMAQRDLADKQAAAEHALKQQIALQEAAARQQRLAPVRGLAAAITDALGPGWSAERWERDRDVRLYLSGPDCTREPGPYGVKKTGSYIEYYLTGSSNGRFTAGQLVVSKIATQKRAFLKALAHNALDIPFSRFECKDMLDPDQTIALPDWYLEIKTNGK